jgi:hypothetical protein
MQASIANIRQRWAKAKLTKSAAFWVAIGAIIFTLYLGFSRGGWVTGGTAQRMADSASQSAVVERLAPICVMQFNQDPLRDQKLEEMKALTSSFRRTSYIKEQGWATMPGEATPDNNVATECAQRLMLVDG